MDQSGFGGVSIFFSAAMTAFVGFPLEIALLSLYSCLACSTAIIPAIANRALFDTDLYAFVIKMRKALWICCSLLLALLDTEVLQASEAYVMTGSMAYL